MNTELLLPKSQLKHTGLTSEDEKYEGTKS